MATSNGLKIFNSIKILHFKQKYTRNNNFKILFLLLFVWLWTLLYTKCVCIKTHSCIVFCEVFVDECEQMMIIMGFYFPVNACVCVLLWWNTTTRFTFKSQGKLTVKIIWILFHIIRWLVSQISQHLNCISQTKILCNKTLYTAILLCSSYQWRSLNIIAYVGTIALIWTSQRICCVLCSNA